MNEKAIATALEDALGENFYKKLTDYSIPSSSRYYGKIFIKVLELPGEGIWYSPDGKISKKRVRAIHFRPYKIESNDIVTLKKAMKDSIFTEENPEYQVDYDDESGNFHKITNFSEPKIKFQLVLVADKYENGEKVGGEKYSPGVPDDYKNHKENYIIKKEKYKILKPDFFSKVDKMGMYFPKITDPANNDLNKILKQVAKALAIDFDEIIN